MILLTPYDSIESLAKEGYPFVPVSLLLTHKFDSLTYGQLRSNRLLCIYGGKDAVIPNHHTKNLLKHWNGLIEDIFLPEADHEDIFYRTESKDGIERFISQL